MLIEFSVSNFLSFKEITTFTMMASSIKDFADTHICYVHDKLSLLKSSVIYGANASGKSNLLKAMNFMANYALQSARSMMAEDRIDVSPFKLNTETAEQPSSFEVIFIDDGVKYRYGFQVTEREVRSEWLYYTPNKREVRLFARETEGYVLGTHFKEGQRLEEKTRDNALFLSVVAQFDGEISKKVIKWFSGLNVIFSLDNYAQLFTNYLMKTDEKMKEQVLRYLKMADLRIEKLELIPHDIPKDFQQLLSVLSDRVKVEWEEEWNVNIYYKKYDREGNAVDLEKFDLDTYESQGTKKFYSLLGPILNTLANGGVLVIDELSSSLHSLLTRFIIDLFHSNEKNPHHAQLIFNTHDTNILNNKVFRRDQIWFTEKDQYGITDLYSLVDYKIRKDASYGKDYLSGRYGAIPFIGNYNLFTDYIGDGEGDGE